MKQAILYDDTGAELWNGSLLQFFHDNAMSRDEASEIITQLRPRPDTGHLEPVSIGGGAAPLFELGLVE